jgi:hypothetical protein
MSDNDDNSPKSKSMAEKVYAIMRGESRPEDFEIPGYYEQTHKISKLPGSHFIELHSKGWKVKGIAQLYGLSEFKVRKILKDQDPTSTYVVYENEDVPLLASRVREAKKIVDSSGHEVDRFDILNLYR